MPRSLGKIITDGRMAQVASGSGAKVACGRGRSMFSTCVPALANRSRLVPATDAEEDQQQDLGELGGAGSSSQAGRSRIPASEGGTATTRNGERQDRTGQPPIT